MINLGFCVYLIIYAVHVNLKCDWLDGKCAFVSAAARSLNYFPDNCRENGHRVGR